MKHAFLISLIPAALLLGACTTAAAYAPARSDGALGYTSQQIETGRHRVSFTDRDAVRARNLALLRASEITLMEGRDWFEVTAEYIDSEGGRAGGGGTSVSIGGATGSGGRSSVGVGVGIGFPLGGSSGSGKFTAVLEIVTGAGEKPDRATVYDARSVDMNLRGQAG